MRLLPVGTRSLLFGVHQFLYHPLTVWLAWNRLYHQVPGIRETLAILVHDWGYWGCPDMDGSFGRLHPEFGAAIMKRLFGSDYEMLVLLHSRTYARAVNMRPSKLAWPDKLHMVYYPRWLYLFLARLSGEITEYRVEAAKFKRDTAYLTDEQWFDWVKEHLTRVALQAQEIQ